MKNIILLFALTSLLVKTNAQEASTNYIYFESDQSTLDVESEKVLNELIKNVQLLNFTKLQLSGHTDDRGDIAYNQALSKRRVEAVQNYLLNKGVHADLISLDYFGELNPLTSNQTADDRQSNRRVEIVAYAEREKTKEAHVPYREPLIITETKPIPTPEPEKVIEAIDWNAELAEFRKAPQNYCIRIDRDTAIQGADGTIIFFEANSFNSKKISCECVEIQLTEYYSSSDLILNNLHTQAGNRILETQGAIRVEAFCEDKKLNLKRGKEIAIYFPGVDPNKEFRLFKGKENKQTRQVDWVADSRSSKEECFGNSGRMGVSDKFDSCDYNFFLKRWICNWKRKKWRKKFLASQSIQVAEAVLEMPDVNFVDMRSRIEKADFSCDLFRSKNLGMINCDRFMNVPRRQLAHVAVQNEADAAVITSIIFKNSMSLMQGSPDAEGKHWFFRIPKNLPVWVVAIKKTNGKYFLALKDTNTSNELIELDFKQMEKEELVASLSKVGW